MIPNGRLKAILIMVAGVSFVVLGIYHAAYADNHTISVEPNIEPIENDSDLENKFSELENKITEKNSGIKYS